MDGWIKLYRKITENPLYFAEVFTRMQAWIDLLIIANHDENYIYVRGNKVIIKRGQVAKTQDTLADRWKWSRGKVIRFLDELQKDNQIVQQKSKLINLISIVNYESYQCGSTTESESEGTTDNTTNNTTNGQQTVPQNKQQIGEQTDVNKNVKKNNILSRKLDNISSPPIGEEAFAPALAREGEVSEPEETFLKPSVPAPAKKQKPLQTQKQPPLQAQKIQDMWNATCSSYPKIFTLSENRKNKIRIRIEEMGGEDKALPLLQVLFEKMQASNFLKGDNQRGWKASFDWLFENDKNWVKVHEGNYDKTQSGSNSKPEEPKQRNYDEKLF